MGVFLRISDARLHGRQWHGNEFGNVVDVFSRRLGYMGGISMAMDLGMYLMAAVVMDC